MTTRDDELQDILNQLVRWRENHQVRNITLTVDGSGYAYAYGWDGAEKVDIPAYKTETPGAATPRESK